LRKEHFRFVGLPENRLYNSSRKTFSLPSPSRLHK